MGVINELALSLRHLGIKSSKIHTIKLIKKFICTFSKCYHATFSVIPLGCNGGDFEEAKT